MQDNFLNKYKDTISFSLLKTVFSIYIVLTIIITLAQMSIEYMNSKNITTTEIRNISGMFKWGITEAIWNFHDEQIIGIIDSMLESSFLVKVELHDLERNKTWEKIKPGYRDFSMIKNSYNLTKIYNNKLFDVGYLVIYSAHEVIFEQVRVSFIIIILNAIIKTILLWIFFLIFGYKLMSKPLNYLVSSIQESIAEEELPKIINIPKEYSSKAEVSNVINSYNQLAKSVEKTQYLLKALIEAVPSLIIIIDIEKNIRISNNALNEFNIIKTQNSCSNYLYDKFSIAQYFEIEINDSLLTSKKLSIQKEVNIAEEVKIFKLDLFATNDDSLFMIIISDQTKEQLIQNSLIHTEKMAALGTMAAGMAHEINNPLGIMLQNIQLIMRRLDPSNPNNKIKCEKIGVNCKHVNDYIENQKILNLSKDIYSAGVRTAELIKNILSFSRARSVGKEKIDINLFLDKTVEIVSVAYDVKTAIGAGKLDIIKEFGQLNFVSCIPSEIQQVFANLLNNSAYAVINSHVDKGIINITTSMDTQMVIINIADNGIGMPEEVLNKIFLPFYTTKPTGVGTGLGMSICHSIIKSHKGTIDVISKEGVGTTFTIKLPLKSDSSEDANDG